ncbi:hypothetical protein PVK06_001437 [Gossypium arboreum]|uniref:Uncharacterized protein n=1 Tax=Gossypium arboreum TaxID=29729 RepID=A0ABR0R231_GOSAR|nr:hypothetical protein PVK06_001437 [Gossypium arboreum]
MANNTNFLTLQFVLEKDKLNGLNFIDWFYNALRVDKDAYKKHLDDILDIGYLILAIMTLELQKQHEDMVAYDMIHHLKELYEGQACQERYKASKALF